MKIIKNSILIIISIISFGCGNDKDKPQSENVNSHKTEVKKTDKQLNITILLDLSDRIEPSLHPNKPEHFERDIEIVNYFTEVFKSDMKAKGAYNAKGIMKIIFSPRPLDEEINTIAQNLNIDLSYLINSSDVNNPLENSLRFSLSFDLGEIYDNY